MMTSNSTCLLALALVGAAASVPAAQAVAPFPETYFFGDGASDGGYHRPLLPVAIRPVTGQFTANPGYVWAEYFAAYYGTGATPNGNGQTGTNFAAGGARVIPDQSGALGLIPSITTQATRYFSSAGGAANPRALYSVWGGLNDLDRVIWAGAPPSTMAAAATGLAGIVSSLSSAGARYIMVAAASDFGLTPQYVTTGAAAQATALIEDFNQQIFSELAASGRNVIPLDVFTFSRELHHEAAAFGFTNTTATVCQPQITSNALTCNPTSVVSPDARNTYLYANGLYHTSRAHDLIAQYAISVVEAPRLVAQLPHAAARLGQARSERVLGRFMALAPQDSGWWIDVRGDVRRDEVENTQHDPAPAILGGFDWRSGDIVFGLFAGYGQGAFDFATGGGAGGLSDVTYGEYDMSDVTIGGYAGWRDDSFWLQAMASYSAVSLDIERRVALGGRVSTGTVAGAPYFVLTDEVLGGVTRAHDGATDGGVTALAFNAGWLFETGAVRHGPIAGVLAQFVEIDGYTESNPALATALAYPDQSYDSIIGSIGWQAAWEASPVLVPYAKAVYQREFGDRTSAARARSLTVAGSPDYAVPDLVFDRDFAAVTLGLRARVLGIDADFGVTGIFGRDDSNDTSAFIRLSGSF